MCVCVLIVLYMGSRNKRALEKCSRICVYS